MRIEALEDEPDFPRPDVHGLSSLSEVILRNLFDEYDASNTGNLEMDEFHNLCYDKGLYLSEQELVNAMAFMDADGSGAIEFEEFRTWWMQDGGKFERLHADNSHALAAAIRLFREFDPNNTGAIPVDEYRQMLKHMPDTVLDVSEGIDEADILALANTVDANNDGYISFNEFLDWINPRPVL
ncbi:caltractin [Thecamonas trahens ATCC 50062]|uniref:Caltractin n=1 Tax=Thecamonas trahens ATCC 50062 TaxID=461836 RepID=A0A0L0D9I8_THETB|nr:caltractin [Thecamonas trahens ATCC 50062]KNC49004.1 caltractin [Thecamonas trahens ATCC 50062]|eukprot:XP_013758415.1 caltractin [Thecamonas trahens ATCC 50062]